MKRKMTGIAAAYIFGSFFASIFSGLPHLIILAAIAVAAALIGRRSGLTVRDFTVMAVSFAAAFTVFTLKQHLVYDRITQYAGQTGSFAGEVTDIRRYGENSLYVLDGSINGGIQAKVTYYGADLDVRYGDIVTLPECRFSLPDSDYLFDGVSYYKSRGVYLEAAAYHGATAVHTGTHRLRNAVADFRERMISRFRIEMGTDCGDFLAGMIFGQKQGLSDTVMTSLYRCGIGHILAVSGLHVSIIAALIMLALRRLRVNRYIAFALMNLMLVFLIIAANYPISAIRAALMLEIAYSARLFRRQNDSFNSLAWAVLLICISDPFVIYSSGFLLSVAGTFGIAVFAPYMTCNIPADKPLQRLWKAFLVMLCTTLAVTPVSMLFFDESSLISPLTNVLLVPMCTGAMVIGLLYVLTGGLLPVLAPAKLLIQAVIFITGHAARLDLTHFSCGSRTLMTIAAACTVLTVTVCIIFRSRKLTALAAAMSVAVLAVGAGVRSDIRYETFTAASLGRGSNCAVVVDHRGNTLIFDLSGHYKTPDYVQKYLTRSGISTAALLSVDRNSASMTSSYAQALEFIRVDETASGSDAEASLNGSISRYSDGVLTLEHEGATAVFLPAGSEELPDADLLIFYGKLPKTAERVIDRAALYLDETNNFEITIGENGDFMIRRL